VTVETIKELFVAVLTHTDAERQYSPDLAVSDSHLFRHLKLALIGFHFHTDK